jgi:hypothetical protein
MDTYIYTYIHTHAHQQSKRRTQDAPRRMLQLIDEEAVGCRNHVRLSAGNVGRLALFRARDCWQIPATCDIYMNGISTCQVIGAC